MNVKTVPAGSLGHQSMDCGEESEFWNQALGF